VNDLNSTGPSGSSEPGAGAPAVPPSVRLSTPPGGDPAERVRAQLEVWRRDLLSLDRRQRSLYFSHTKSASLELLAPDPAALLARLESGHMIIEVPGPYAPERTRAIGVLNKTETELATSLRRLDTVSNQIYADRGFWPLSIGLGFLRWTDPDDGRSVESPLLLVPVKLQRTAARQPYTVFRTEDDPVLNPALRLKLENDFKIALPDFEPDDFSLDALFARVQAAVAGQPGWTISSRAVMTTFSFHKEAIYRDLLDNEEMIVQEPLIQLLALGPDAPDAPDFGFTVTDEADLDLVLPPEQLRSILDADGSQRQCILAARDGRSFVMDGPPGTGKSQTIANIIVELMASGRSVLFVSEKAAALDVVRNRLSSAQLGSFLLELHSHSATRKQVVVELDAALNKKVRARRTFGAADESSLMRTRIALSEYATAINEIRPGLGGSLHAVLGRLGDLAPVSQYLLPADSSWAERGVEHQAMVREQAVALSRAWRPVVEGDAFLWQGLAAETFTPESTQRLIADARRAADCAAELARVTDAVDLELGFSFGGSLDDARRRAALLELVAHWPQAPVPWLTSDSLEPVRARQRARQRQAGEHANVVADLVAAAGPNWTELDGDRFSRLTAPGAAGEWLQSNDPSASHLAQLLQMLSTTPTVLARIATDARLLAELLGLPSDDLTPDQVERLAGLAEISEEPARPEASWFHPSVQRALQESARVLEELVEAVRASERSLSSVFTQEALALDLASLQVRFTESHRGLLGRFSSQARADRKALKAVTVSQKVTKDVLERLPEAVAWQAATRRLGAGEADHAVRLGTYYRRTDTDFGRVASAVEAAQRALQLAGDDLDPTALSRQLALGAIPHQSLTLAAARIRTQLGAWFEQWQTLMRFAPESVAHMSLDGLASGSREWLAALEPASEAVDHVARVCRRDVTVSESRSVLQAAARAASIQAEVFNGFDDDQALLGPLYTGLDTVWSTLDAAIDWAERVRTATGGPVSPVVAAGLQSPSILAVDLVRRVEAWTAARDRLTRAFRPARAIDLQRDLDARIDEAAEIGHEMAAAGAVDIAEWERHQAARTALVALGLAGCVEAITADRVPAGTVVHAIEHALMHACADAVIRADPRLLVYRAGERDDLVARFRDLDRRLVDDAHAAVIDACNQRRPRSLTGRGAQRIRREAQKKSRHLPVRQLLDEAADVVHLIKPCFMMSPLSVSQYLPAQMRFDVVIFDEASQMLPSDAVNCIYRGRQLIVAGDQKQLPPTSFFAASTDDEETDTEVEVDRFDSVLDLSKAAGVLPSLSLNWHYRSQHEDLITYSNYRFYRGELQTFPGATFEAPDLGVAAYVVQGTYRRGGARDNPIEAAAVVDRVAHHHREHPHLSLGVVTFSTAQADTVLAELERRCVTDPGLGSLLQDHDRLGGFFVKSLENVQGDERDVIVISVGYGPDEHGRMTNNFGPINRAGGWRRLNVAITRAKRRAEIVSSFRASAITESTNESVRHLRAYLDFADRGLPALAVDLGDQGGDAESPFEEDVLSVIHDLGYRATPQIGAAGYRIDIAVQHPDRPGSYLLAVECDGATYHSAKVARDRDRLRESVLRGLGWRVHRIWSISWVRERDTQIARLRAAIEAAYRSEAGPRADAPAAAPLVTVEEVDFDAPPDWAVPYRVALPVYAGGTYDPASTEARPLLKRYFGAVLAVEAPVHEDVLLQRFRRDWSVGRVGHLIRANLESVLAALEVDSRRVEYDERGFYRLRGQRLAQVRVPSDDETTRKVGHVPPEELELAVLSVVEDAVVAGRTQVEQAVAHLFGWRLSAELQMALESTISRLVNARRLSQSVSGELSQAGQ
jgi:very-short-patch-repair endonuclease